MKNKNSNSQSRRKFIYDIGLTALSVPALSALSSCGDNQAGNNKKEEDPNQQRIEKEKAAGKLGIALVGLGSYAGGQLAPALQETEHCYLAGIVTGTPSKAEEWKAKYGIPSKNIYNYQSYDKIRDNPDIDIIYVVLPNSMHAEYSIRAAQAGKHVICEKPMAITVADCDKMIAACKQAEKMLSIGYRLHFEPYNLEMARLGQQKVYGEIKKLTAEFGFNAPKGIWRLDKELAGGGPLMDVGIYCVQAFCYVTGKEPIAVRAKEGPKTDLDRFSEVEQSLSWQFEMPGGLIAEGKSSYAEGMNNVRAEAEKGWFELKPAFNYGGIQGSTSDGGAMNLPHVNQQARQMDDFAKAIKEKRPSPVPGEMGRRDVKLLQAIYESIRTGQRVEC
jgi:predicted dehydrogenase